MSTSHKVDFSTVNPKSLAVFFGGAVLACIVFVAISKHAEKAAHAMAADAIAEARAK